MQCALDLQQLFGNDQNARQHLTLTYLCGPLKLPRVGKFPEIYGEIINLEKTYFTQNTYIPDIVDVTGIRNVRFRQVRVFVIVSVERNRVLYIFSFNN